MKIEFKSILQPIDNYFDVYIDNNYYSSTPCFSLDRGLKIYGDREQTIPLRAGDAVYRNESLLYKIPEPKEKPICDRLKAMLENTKLSKNTVNN